jgi:3,4-dihydroxy-2-butanone 4-phosphate synthase
LLEQIRQEYFQDVLNICEYLKSGGMIVLIDEEKRENEGDLCIAAEGVKPVDLPQLFVKS